MQTVRGEMKRLENLKKKVLTPEQKKINRQTTILAIGVVVAILVLTAVALYISK